MTDVEEVPDLDYGLPLGACQGVVAYSNLDSYYFSGEKHFCQGVFTGYKYQCVEFARRHMLLTTGYIFGQCGPAHEIFDMDKVTSVITKEETKWVACPNGKTNVKPRAGMTFVYPIDKKMPVGHVAVIAEVGEDWVGIAEENEGSKPWNGKAYGRKLPLTYNKEQDAWTIVEPDPHFVPSRGWLYIEGVEPVKPLDGVTEADMTALNDKTLHEKIYPKHNVAKDLVDEQHGPKMLAKFECPSVIPENGASDSSARKPLIDEYLKLVAEQGKSLKEGEFDDGGANYRNTGLSGVKRRQEFSSVYSGNMEMGVATIGMSMRGFRLVEMFLAHQLLETNMSDEDIATRYKMPKELVPMVKGAFTADTAHSSAALSQVDFALGTMGLVYDNKSDSFRMLHTEFDSLPYLIDMNAFQEPYVYGKSGITQCWVMTSYGYDFHRAVRNFQTFKLHNKKANEVLYGIDFGSVEDLAAKGITFKSKEEEDAYKIERLNHLYNMEVLKEVLIEKKKDFDNGDIPDEDLPKWTIQSVKLDDLAWDAATGKVTVGDKEARLMWKCASWRTLFALSGTTGAEKIRDFVYQVGAKNIGVFQPVWAHVASQQTFLYDMAKWAESSAAPEEIEDVGRPKDFVLPSSSWPDGPEGRFNAVFQPPTTKVNPTINGEAWTKKTEENEGPSPSKPTYAAMHCLLAGGKRSAGIWLESKSNTEDIGGVSPNFCVHPAPAPFVRAEIGWEQ